MADLVVSGRAVRPMAAPDPDIRDFTAGGVVNIGDVVYVDSTGKVQQGNAGAAGTCAGIVGVAVSVGSFGALVAALGDVVSVLIQGAVNGYTVNTIGAKVYASNTAGRIADAVGTVTKVVGIALSADTILILPLLTG
jgi:hypothetical protein